MDPRLLSYYERELQHLREMGGEFAQQYPKVAGRLGLDAFECADPYVERLLEGFAFLAARIQLKRDACFPRFTYHLLEMLVPQYVAPLPSMAIVEFTPDLNQGELSAGYHLPRGTTLRSKLGSQMSTACEYRTAHDLDLWPIEITQAEYLTRDLTGPGLPDLGAVAAGLRLRLRVTAGLKLADLRLDKLPLYLRGADGLGVDLYEHLLRDLVRIVVRSPATAADPAEQRPISLGPDRLRRHGFAPEQALLPAGPRTFEGYRLLHEYFAFPERFMFVELTGLQPVLRSLPGSEADLVFLFRRRHPSAVGRLAAENFVPFCVPAINLFPKRTDRIPFDATKAEHHLVVDRQRPMDYEVYQVAEVQGYKSGVERATTYRPLFALQGHEGARSEDAYFTTHRALRRVSERERRYGPRSSYVGSEIYLAFVDGQHAPYDLAQDQFDAHVLCTNRDLSLQMPVGKGSTDFSLLSGAPVERTRIVAGPTRPRSAVPEGETAWRVINHLSLNYLSLSTQVGSADAQALRQLLGLYGDLLGEADREAVTKQIDAIRGLTARPVARLHPAPGPATYVRGLELELLFDEAHSGGANAFLFGTVLAEFFARHVSINSFTETILRTPDRGEVMRWPSTMGRRSTL